MAHDIVERFEQEGRDRFAFAEGAVETLRLLDEFGVPRSVITRNSARSLCLLNEKLLEAGVEPFPEHLSLGREYEPAKPAPDSAVYVCEKMGVPTKEALFIGDGVHDLLCAKQAGCVPILIRNAGDHDEKHVQHTREVEQKHLHAHVFDSLVQAREELLQTIVNERPLQ